MTIPEDIRKIYQQQRDWQKRIEMMHATETDTYSFAKRSADALRWAVAQAMEAEHKQDSWHLSGHNCSKCIRENIWLAEAEAKLMEPVKEKSDG